MILPTRAVPSWCYSLKEQKQSLHQYPHEGEALIFARWLKIWQLWRKIPPEVIRATQNTACGAWCFFKSSHICFFFWASQFYLYWNISITYTFLYVSIVISIKRDHSINHRPSSCCCNMRCMQLTYYMSKPNTGGLIPYMLRICTVYGKMNSCIFDVWAPCKLQSVCSCVLAWKNTFPMKNNYNFLAKNAVITTPAAVKNRLAIVHVRSPIMLMGREKGGQTEGQWDRGCDAQGEKKWGRLRQPTLSDHYATATHQNSVIMRQ